MNDSAVPALARYPRAGELYWPSYSATGVYMTVDLRTHVLMWMTSR
ncbi:hypothetical protein ACWEQ4_08470 [Rhodococcus sp. NPDC003994]